MDSLANLLKTHISQTPILRKATAALVVEVANKIIQIELGEAGEKFAKAIYVKNGILTCACLSSTAAQEIKLNEKKIVSFINEKFNKKVVDKLRFLS